MRPEGIKRRISYRLDAIATALGVTKRGYFVPYRYAGAIDRRVGSYPAIASLLERGSTETEAWISGIGQHIDAFKATDTEPSGARWRTRFFAPRDAATAYTMVRAARPKRILEIGSGTSTWFMAKALSDGELDCVMTCIDPAPRHPIADLKVRHVARTLRCDDEGLAAELEPGDILFIDSSHVMLPGMDVDIEFNIFFPRLASGVIVHVHDVFLPYDYPWRYRMYSEQNALIGWLYSGYFNVLYPGYYASRRHAAAWDRLAARFAPLADRAAGSIWLKRS